MQFKNFFNPSGLDVPILLVSAVVPGSECPESRSIVDLVLDGLTPIVFNTIDAQAAPQDSCVSWCSNFTVSRHAVEFLFVIVKGFNDHDPIQEIFIE